MPPTMSQAWVDRYEAELLARLEWELDAGWRTVSDPNWRPGLVDPDHKVGDGVARDRAHWHDLYRPVRLRLVRAS